MILEQEWDRWHERLSESGPLNVANQQSALPAGVRVSLPEGARFPLLEAKDGGRLNVSEILSSTSSKQVTGLRFFASRTGLQRVAVLLSGELGPNAGEYRSDAGRSSQLLEFTWRSGESALLKRKIPEVHDSVYLSDGALLFTTLERTQPRRLFFLSADGNQQQEVQLEIASTEFLQLSVAHPQRIMVRSWENRTRELQLERSTNPVTVRLLSDRSEGATDTPRTGHFGCRTLDSAALAQLGARCESRDVSPANEDSQRVPVSILRSSSRESNGAPSMVVVRSYGAYGQPLPVSIGAFEMMLLRRGAVIVYAHIGGGGELGDAWHARGRGARRPQSIADLRGVVQHAAQRWPGVPIVLESTSGGSLTALWAAYEERGTVQLLYLLSPLLDVPQTLVSFADDRPEFEGTPEHLYRVFDEEFVKKLPPAVIVCGRLDPLVPFSSCERLRDAPRKQSPESGSLGASSLNRLTLYAEERFSHERATSLGMLREREVHYLEQLVQFGLPARAW